MSDFDPGKLLGGMGMSGLFEHARELQEKLARLQEDLRHRTVDATVGGGMVEVTVNGRGDLVSVRIDPQAVDPRDVEMLQDLIVAAVNQGTQRARELAEEETRRVTGLPLDQLQGLLGGSGS